MDEIRRMLQEGTATSASLTYPEFVGDRALAMYNNIVVRSTWRYGFLAGVSVLSGVTAVDSLFKLGAEWPATIGLSLVAGSITGMIVSWQRHNDWMSLQDSPKSIILTRDSEPKADSVRTVHHNILGDVPVSRKPVRLTSDDGKTAFTFDGRFMDYLRHHYPKFNRDDVFYGFKQGGQQAYNGKQYRDATAVMVEHGILRWTGQVYAYTDWGKQWLDEAGIEQ